MAPMKRPQLDMLITHMTMKPHTQVQDSHDTRQITPKAHLPSFRALTHYTTVGMMIF